MMALSLITLESGQETLILEKILKHSFGQELQKSHMLACEAAA